MIIENVELTVRSLSEDPNQQIEKTNPEEEDDKKLDSSNVMSEDFKNQKLRLWEENMRKYFDGKQKTKEKY